jgi:LysR family glycine cleavage system transcriptional activator
MDLTFTPMCSCSFLNEHGQVTIENLAGFPLLHDRDYGEWARLAGSLDLAALDFRKGHIIGDTALLEQAAIQGNGIALCALQLTENAVQRGDLIPPLPDLKIRSDKSYYLLRQQSIKPTIIGAQFSEWLHQTVT